MGAKEAKGEVFWMAFMSLTKIAERKN